MRGDIDIARAMRTLPHNLEAEQGLLGALLLENRQLEQVSDQLRPEHFFAPAHGRIYGAIVGLVEKGMVATPVTLKNLFENDRDLENIGGSEYLAALLGNVISLFNTGDYARTIRDLHLRREIITQCREAENSAFIVSHDSSAQQVMEGLEASIYRLAETGSAASGPENINVGLTQALDMIDRAQKGEIGGLKTGIKALDDHLNNLQGGDLILIAARPSMGKTVKALTLAHNIAEAGNKVLFFNLEMTAAQMALRLYARHTGMPVQGQLRQGDMKSSHMQDLLVAKQYLSKLPLHIDESAGLSAAQIKSRARRHKRRHGLDLIVIDYLGLMTPPDGYHQKVDQLGEITKSLKNMAKEFGVPIILLHQLSRAVEGRDSKRPMLSDLRDSGAIEQDADIVLFLYREEYYLSREVPEQKAGETGDKFAMRQSEWEIRSEAAKGKAEVIVGKFRQGECGIIRVAFNGARQVFTDISN